MDKKLKALESPGKSATDARSLGSSLEAESLRESFIVRNVLITSLNQSFFPLCLSLSLVLLTISVVPTYYVSFYPQVLFREVPRKECLKQLSPKKLDFCIGGFKWNG